MSNFKYQISNKNHWTLEIGNWKLEIPSLEAGFSLIEFLAVIGIVIFLTGFITVSLATTQQHTSINTTVDELISDMKTQQLKAMLNDTEGRGTDDTYGIYFQSTKYTLFHGAVYSSGDPANFVVNLDTNLQFSTINLPSTSVIFAKGSGEVVGFVTNSNTVTVKNTVGNNTKTLTINQYGTVITVN